MFFCCRKSKTTSPDHQQAESLTPEKSKDLLGIQTVVVDSNNSTADVENQGTTGTGTPPAYEGRNQPKLLSAIFEVDSDSNGGVNISPKEKAAPADVEPSISKVVCDPQSCPEVKPMDDVVHDVKYVAQMECLVCRLETVADTLESARRKDFTKKGISGLLDIRVTSLHCSDIHELVAVNLFSGKGADMEVSEVQGTYPSTESNARNESRCVLNGNTWTVENIADSSDIIVNTSSSSQSVLVSNCGNSTIQIKGSSKMVTIDQCVGCRMAIDDIDTSLNMTRCSKIQTQVFGKVKSINLDQTDGLSIYLSPDAASAPLKTRNCSEINLLIPDGEDGQFVEHAVPEQFRTVWNGQCWVTQVSDINQ